MQISQRAAALGVAWPQVFPQISPAVSSGAAAGAVSHVATEPTWLTSGDLVLHRSLSEITHTSKEKIIIYCS